MSSWGMLRCTSMEFGLLQQTSRCVVPWKNEFFIPEILDDEWETEKFSWKFLVYKFLCWIDYTGLRWEIRKKMNVRTSTVKYTYIHIYNSDPNHRSQIPDLIIQPSLKFYILEVCVYCIELGSIYTLFSGNKWEYKYFLYSHGSGSCCSTNYPEFDLNIWSESRTFLFFRR